MLRRRRGAAGFTLIEIMISLVIVALVAGVVSMAAVNRLSVGESAVLAQNLTNLAQGIHSFRSDVGRYPSRVQDLATPIAAGSRDPCGRTLDTAAWRGPYLDREVLASGLVSGATTLSDAITRVPVSTTGFGHLRITAQDVDLAVAEGVEKVFDGNGDFSAGNITWSEAGGAGRGSLVFTMPVRGC